MNRTIEVDTSELFRLVGDLEHAAEILQNGIYSAINRVTDTVREDTVRNIVSKIRLDPKEVDTNVKIKKYASEAKPEAIIEIADEPHFLSTYPTRQRSAANVWTAGLYAQTFGSTGRNAKLPTKNKPLYAPWIPRTGDPLVGVPAGQKKAGLEIAIHAGRGSTIFPHVFIMPVRSGKVMKGRTGSFTHPKAGGDAKAKYGPSEYQAAIGIWRDGEEKIGELLDAEAFNEVTTNVDKALGLK